MLRAGESRPELVPNTTVLIADTNDFAELNELYAGFFPTDPPARMTMQVPALVDPFSIGCIAFVDG